jgi:methylenetetrahydrofolate reductase (NADPH)
MGKYMHDVMHVDNKADFCIGVAGYPEKHLESPSIIRFKRLKAKVDAGADYVVTQMFFDNAKYFEFVAKAREMGIMVPIIPGIKPLAVQRHLQIATDFQDRFAEDLIHRRGCKTNADIKTVGIEWAIQQSLELKAAGFLFYIIILWEIRDIKQIARMVLVDALNTFAI